MAPRSFARMAALGEGWVAPALALDVLLAGIRSARRAWAVRPSVATTQVQLQRQLDQLGAAGFHDIVLCPCTPDPDQARRIASALDVTGDRLARLTSPAPCG